MAKVYEVFEHDIKRKFNDVMTVEDSDSIKAIDIILSIHMYYS